MAGEGQGYGGIVLPSIFGSPADALKSGIALKERQAERADALDVRREAQANRQSEIDYRRAKDAQLQADKDEMDNYRKVQMIKEYTDLSKHQTGNDIADAIGNNKAQELIGKYTGMLSQNKQLSYADLLSGINRDMGGVVSSLDAMKNELGQSDEAIKLLKTKFPELDTTALMQQHRADILHRRVDPKGSFINPMQVAPSTFEQQLTNPDFLSQYVQGNKNLTDAIINPKGADPSSVFMGKPDAAHTKFEANIPYWKKPNFDPTGIQNGFLPKGVVPELQLKGSVIPAASIPSSNGKPFTVIDKDVYERFAQDPKSNLELIASTRQRYPNYNNFNQTEKEYAKRNVLYDQIKTLDQSQYHPTATSNTPRTTVNVGSGGNADAANIRNVWKGVIERVGKTPEGKLTPLNELSSTAQQELVKMANQIAGKKDEAGTPYTNSDIALKKESDGTINIRKVVRGEDGKIKSFDEIITPLDETAMNLPAQANVKAKVAVVQQGNKQPTYKYNGKEYTEVQLQDAAKKSGMSLAEYKKELNLK